MCPAEFAAHTKGVNWRERQRRHVALLSGWSSALFTNWRGAFPSLSRAIETVFGREGDDELPAGAAPSQAGEHGVRRVRAALSRLAKISKRRP